MNFDSNSNFDTGNAKYTYLVNENLGDNIDTAFGKKAIRNLGSIYTPKDLARFLTSWAIQNSEDKVLDMGIGEGAFVFAAYQRLLELGARETNARRQLYGTEIDAFTYSNFLELASKTSNQFPNLQNADFFNTEFPRIDAVIGNPPYVRRTYIENIEEIRRSIFEKDKSISELDIPRMADLYIYFLLHALPNLKPDGRLAVIVADSWLNVGYGEGFKRYLLQHFKIESLISLDRRIFDNALVKPVLLLAEKRACAYADWDVPFIRIKNGLPFNKLQNVLDQPNISFEDVTHTTIKNGELKATMPWSIYFKAPEIYEELASHTLMTSISKIAETRIGIQTLAKEFFVLTPEQAEIAQIESEFLEPLAQSLRYINEPIIEQTSEPLFFLFYCSKSKEELAGTYAFQYILNGERAKVSVRGKNITVSGYQNKERIIRSSRKYWYDLKTSIERRGRASILIPRLVYHAYKVVWNKGKFVPGELFIEFLPNTDHDIEVYLAILTSSISEIMLRVHAQVYGGGTYNINPGEIKSVPIINVESLTSQQRESLRLSYLKYLFDQTHDRSPIDNVIYDILGLDTLHHQKIKEVLEDLLLIATHSKKLTDKNILGPIGDYRLYKGKS